MSGLAAMIFILSPPHPYLWRDFRVGLSAATSPNGSHS
jgi:hypothetical protein